MRTVNVGIPAGVKPELLRTFPTQAAVIPIEADLARPLDIEFWVAPFYAREAHQAFPHLRGVRVVQSLLAGVDWLQALLPPGITLCDGQGMHNIPTAEWTVAAILNSLKFFPLYNALQQAHDWRGRTLADELYRSLQRTSDLNYPPVLQEELYGKRALIIGYGSIGRSIEERLAPFGVDIVRVARSARPGVEPVSRLLDLLPSTDIIILIVPQTPETAGLIGVRELDRMKQGALLVNAARGPVVDTSALVTALDQKRIRAALDVTDPEPLPADHPLWSAPNVFITPHVAASSPAMMSRAIAFAAQQVERYLAGQPLHNIVTGAY
ncbi:MAG TPA: 2-hydroxyacid dehydrogenase [Acidobacteriaceae bacterium]|nr:2-hydroxyacid dehydrogenase [Acidobacteriaceae bacterium]